MGLFNFLKTKKTEENENKFVGRHQQVCLIKQMLGNTISDLEIQIATNKDLLERNEILEKLEDTEKYIQSEYYTTRYDVGTTLDEIKKILNKGYDYWVLQNDCEIENRCLDIYTKVIEYSISKQKNTLDEETIKNMRELPVRQTGLSLLSIMDGSIFDSPVESHAWLIYLSLIEKIGNLDTSDLVTFILSEVGEKNLDTFVSGLKLANEKLLKTKAITKQDFKKIDMMITAGITKNKETNNPIL